LEITKKTRILVLEFMMDNIKKIIVEEIRKVIKEKTVETKKNKLRKNLYEAVKTKDYLQRKLEYSKSRTEAKKYFNKLKVSAKLIETIEKNISSLNENDHYDGEGEMFKAQLLSIIQNAKELYHRIDDDEFYEDWLQAKVTIAEDYLRAVNGYLKYFNGEHEMKHQHDDDEWDDENEWDDNYWDDIEEEDEDFEDDGFMESTSDDMDDEDDK